jgi:hypothetical protein
MSIFCILHFFQFSVITPFHPSIHHIHQSPFALLFHPFNIEYYSMSYLQRRKKNLPTLPQEDGFRMPAEWEAHEGCWMAWPVREDNYRLEGLPAQEAWAEVINAIIDYEPVSIFVPFDHFEKVSELLDPRVRLIETSYDDAWLRDIGPTFVVKDDQTSKTREVRGVDWRLVTPPSLLPPSRDSSCSCSCSSFLFSSPSPSSSSDSMHGGRCIHLGSMMTLLLVKCWK